MHQLVCSGYARPGQTSTALLDSLALDVLLHFGYGMLIAGAEPDEKTKVDNMLKSLDELAADPSKTIRKTLSDGRVVQLSEARLARIRANARGMAEMKGLK